MQQLGSITVIVHLVHQIKRTHSKSIDQNTASWKRFRPCLFIPCGELRCKSLQQNRKDKTNPWYRARGARQQHVKPAELLHNWEFQEALHSSALARTGMNNTDLTSPHDKKLRKLNFNKKATGISTRNLWQVNQQLINMEIYPILLHLMRFNADFYFLKVCEKCCIIIKIIFQELCEICFWVSVTRTQVLIIFWIWRLNGT